jgi:hypothetical protein
MLTIGVHGDRPVHEEQVHVVQTQILETDIKTLFGAGVECTPQLRRNEDVLALNYVFAEGFGKGGADFNLITVDVGGINVAVARLESCEDSGLDFAGRGLPCAYTLSVFIQNVHDQMESERKIAYPDRRRGLYTQSSICMSCLPFC